MTLRTSLIHYYIYSTIQYYTILRIFRSRCRNQSKGDQTQANRRDQRIKVLKQFKKTMVYDDCKDPMLDIKESRSTAPYLAYTGMVRRERDWNIGTQEQRTQTQELRNRGGKY